MAATRPLHDDTRSTVPRHAAAAAAAPSAESTSRHPETDSSLPPAPQRASGAATAAAAPDNLDALVRSAVQIWRDPTADPRYRRYGHLFDDPSPRQVAVGVARRNVRTRLQQPTCGAGQDRFVAADPALIDHIAAAIIAHESARAAAIARAAASLGREARPHSAPGGRTTSPPAPRTGQ